MKLLTNCDWVIQNFENVQLGDKRRNVRLQKIASHMISMPEASLPQQNVAWADLKAAYRFFHNDCVTFDGVAEAHWQQTRRTKPGRYLLISDTTGIDKHRHKATTGMGFLGNGLGRGLQLHSCLVYDSMNKQIEGVAGAAIHYRKRVRKNETRSQRMKRIRESALWSDVVEQAGAPPSGSQWIHVFDRGGDDFEAMCRMHQLGCDWIIRAAKRNRNILHAGKKIPLKAALDCDEELGSYELHLRKRQGVKARTAKIRVSRLSIEIPQPHLRTEWLKKCGIESLSINIVIVRECNAPRGVKPIEWVLLTSLPVSNFEQAWQIIEDYECRWLIEEYHKAMKSGCSIELHALRSAEALEPLVGLISVVATRLLQMKLIGRNRHKALARNYVPSQWLKCLLLVRPKLSKSKLTVYEFFRQLAMLGGFIGRRSDGEPGWQTVWRGYRRMQTLLDGMNLAEAT